MPRLVWNDSGLKSTLSHTETGARSSRSDFQTAFQSLTADRWLWLSNVTQSSWILPTAFSYVEWSKCPIAYGNCTICIYLIFYIPLTLPWNVEFKRTISTRLFRCNCRHLLNMFTPGFPLTTISIFLGRCVRSHRKINTLWHSSSFHPAIRVLKAIMLKLDKYIIHIMFLVLSTKMFCCNVI